VAPEAAALFGGERLHERDREALEELLATFPRVPTPAAPAGRPRTYFLGVPPRWEDLAAGFDAPRDMTASLIQAVEGFSTNGRLGIVGLIGPAGSGKSTILMRIALTLRQQGREVFYSEGADRPDVVAVARALGVVAVGLCCALTTLSCLARSHTG